MVCNDWDPEKIRQHDYRKKIQDEAFADRDRLLADIDALTAERDAWRNAVIDAAVVNWTYTAEDEDNPYLAVCKLLACAAQEALDPQIGLDAKALHDRIAELQRRLDAVVMSLKPGEKPVREKLMDYEEWSLVLDRYAESKRIHTRALAIAEGREE